MTRWTLVFHVVLFIALGCWSASIQEVRQERAKVVYANPKYIANVSVITRRVSRHEPYRTNLTATLLTPYGNNVTFALILQLKTGGDFKVQAKVCDTVKTKWMNKYMSQFTNLTLDNCPFPAGTYVYINMELPPKNVPIPVMDGDYYIIMELTITATKEKILTASTLLHFDGKAAAAGKPDARPGDKNKDKTKDKHKDKKT